MFNKTMLDRLEDILLETCEQMKVELLEFGGEDDHIHLLVNVPPKIAIANLVGKLKGKSAYVLRKEFWPQLKSKLWGSHLWSPSYCVVSCGGASLDVVKQYVKNQRQPPNEKQINQSLKISHKKNNELA